MCEYFGNQASLTNCSGTLIRLIDSTASAPPMRRNKGSFQRVSFLIIHMSWVIFYHLIFRDVSLKSQKLSVLFSSHFNGFILFNLFRWNASFSCPFYFVDLFVYLFVIIRLFIRIFPHFYFIISVSYSLKLFSCLSFILFRIRCSLLNCANSVLFVCSLTASLISAVCILDCCCLPGPKKLKRLGVEPDAANLCQSLKKIVLRNFVYHTTILTNRFFLL